MYKLVNGQLLNIIEVVTPNQIALVTTTAHMVIGYDSDTPIDIESIPEKNEPASTTGELHYINGVLQWVYVDKPPTVDDQVQQLIVENAALREQVAQTNADAVGFQEFIFASFPELA